MYLDETERLFIRKLEPYDAKEWESFFENNPSLPFLGIDLNPDNEINSINWINFQLERYKNNRFGHKALVAKQNNKLIGQCGLLSQEVYGKAEIEIGYHILPKYWGNGYATEAAGKFRDYAFNENLSNSLVSIIDIKNIASQRVAQKIGMKRIKQIKYSGLNVYIYRIYK
jgi:RimJ/RimL family protein N-acetyltransferase